MDWLDLLAVQGTLKSLQHHSSKASVLWRSAFFIIQFSHPYMTTGKTIALTRQTFVGKVMSLLFNMLTRLVGHNFPSKRQVSFNFMAAITICSDFGAPQNSLSLFPLLPLKGPTFSSSFPGGSDSKESACNAGDSGSIPESGRSPGEGNGYPLQYSCLENSMDRGAQCSFTLKMNLESGRG